MSTFSEFSKALLELSKSFEDTQLKIEHDEKNDIIKIFGEKITALARAKNGLEDVAEMSYTVAEHHPYWNLLYQCSQISKTILEKWEGELSPEEIDDIDWSLDELKNTCEKLKNQITEK